MSDPYSISPADAVYLMALMKGESLPARTPEDLRLLLVQVCRLSETITTNCKEWLEMAAIIHGEVHPYSAEKLNVPTLKGALASAITVPRLADCSGLCLTCAFRVGSPANQTEAVAEDVMLALESGETFYCHDVGLGEEPKHPCRGWVAAMKAKQCSNS